MNLRSGSALFFVFASMLASIAAEPAPAPRPTFGPYEAIIMDKTMLQNVKVDPADGAIYLMFQPEKRDAQVRIKISMAEGAEYRKWFNGEDELVALENAHREPNTWTDRVVTSSNYIEYRAAGQLFLHLKKTKP